ncbi:MAG: transcriptional repressor [Acidovorax sp.]|jgi:Fur family ferric uptake transcriptional regulator|nr:transcriptional repressor [Acidovorax sp.]
MTASSVSRRRSLLAGESALPAGMRSTRATRALLALLRSQSAQRLSAADAEAALARLGVVVNRVTVFRALDRLAQAGLLQRRVDDDRVTRYQWRGDSTPTQQVPGPVEEGWVMHFRCQQCQQRVAVDIAAPGIGQALQGLARSLLAVGQVQQLELQGCCAACQAMDSADGTAR